MPPFTIDQFFGGFHAYNSAVFPAQVLLITMAVGIVYLAVRPAPWSPRSAGAILALLWAWTGVVYHFLFFTRVTPAAYLFGSLFVLQALLVGWAALRRRLDLQIRHDIYGVVGGAIALYALVGYPLVGFLTGHAYPDAPTFGAPCPTTIFTFGALLWVNGPVPRRLLAVPIAWTLLGSSAIWTFGVIEDVGMPIAAALATPLLLWRNHRFEAIPPASNRAWIESLASDASPLEPHPRG